MFTLAFSVGAPCEGGNHFPITVTRVETGQQAVIARTKAEYRAPLNADERQQLAELLVRAMVPQMVGSGALAIKTALEAKIVDLTLVG